MGNNMTPCVCGTRGTDLKIIYIESLLSTEKYDLKHICFGNFFYLSLATFLNLLDDLILILIDVIILLPIKFHLLDQKLNYLFLKQFEFKKKTNMIRTQTIQLGN